MCNKAMLKSILQLQCATQPVLHSNSTVGYLILKSLHEQRVM